MNETNTAMGLAFIQAQQRVNQEQQVEAQAEPKSIANRVFDHLKDEGIPLNVDAVANALGVTRQQVSTAFFQLKKSGYVKAHATAGSYMTYEALPDVEYGMARTHRLNKRVSQVVTQQHAIEPPKKIMQALPAPVGLKLTIQTDDGPVVMSIGMAKEVYRQLCGLFGDVRVGGFDD